MPSRVRLTEEANPRLVDLKEINWTWDGIEGAFPGRSRSTLQVHYSTELKIWPTAFGQHWRWIKWTNGNTTPSRNRRTARELDMRLTYETANDSLPSKICRPPPLILLRGFSDTLGRSYSNVDNKEGPLRRLRISVKCPCSQPLGKRSHGTQRQRASHKSSAPPPPAAGAQIRDSLATTSIQERLALGSSPVTLERLDAARR